MPTISNAAGYRDTNPCRVYLSDKREELESLDSPLSTYSDPWDLTNTFMNWEMDFGKGAGVIATLQLINPGVQIEQKLFSIFNVQAPRSYAAKTKSGVTVMDKRAIAADLDNTLTTFVRWGYISNASPGEQEVQGKQPEQKKAALSHIHEMVLMTMGYEMTVDSDKVVTLTFATRYHAANSSRSFNSYGRTVRVPLDDGWKPDGTGKKGKFRKASAVLEDYLTTTLLGAEKYLGYSRWTDNQRERINNDFEKYTEVSGISAYSTFRQDDPKAKELGWAEETWGKLGRQRIAKAKEWYGMIPGVNASFIWNFNWGETGVYKSGPSLDQLGADDTPNPAQDGIPAGGSNNTGRAQASVISPYAIPPQKYPVSMLGKTDPTMMAGFPPLGPVGPPLQIMPMVSYWACKDDKGDFYTDLSFEDVHKLTDKKKGFICFDNLIKKSTLGYLFPPIQLPPFYPSPAHVAFLAQVGSPPSKPQPAFAKDPLTFPGAVSGDFSGAMVFDLTDADVAALKAQLQAAAAEAQQKANEKAFDQLREESRGTVIGLQTSQGRTLSPAQAGGLNGTSVDAEGLNGCVMYMSVAVPPGKMLAKARDLVLYLNTQYFLSIDDYLQVEVVELAHVPTDCRPHVETVLSGLPITWDGRDRDTGIVVVGPSKLFSELYAWDKDNPASKGITSFPGIQLADADERPTNKISLSVGNPKRSDSIVTSLNWNIETANLMYNLRGQHVAYQTALNVAKRWEDKQLRDVVMEALVTYQTTAEDLLAADEIARLENQSPYIRVGLAQKEHNRQRWQDMKDYQAYRETSKFKVKDLKIGGVAGMTKSAIDDALPAALKRMRADIKNSDPQTISNDAKRKAEVLAAFYEDYQMMGSPYIDAFFPGISKENMSQVEYSAYSDNEEILVNKKKTMFRQVAASPMANLMLMEYPTADRNMRASQVQALNQYTQQMINVELEMLGVPEMDILANEVQNREISLWVHEARDPGKYHYTTGRYNILTMSHYIDDNGYRMRLTCNRNPGDLEEYMTQAHTLSVFN